MKRPAWTAGIVVLVITAATAGFLATQHLRQKLGRPGVREEAQAIYKIDLNASTNAPEFLSSNRVYLPPKVLDFASQAAPIPRITADSLPRDTVFGHRVYARSNGLALDLQVVLMGADRSSIHKPQYCLKGSGFAWKLEEPTTIRITRPHAYDLPVMKMNLRRQVRDANGAVRNEAAVFVYWFVADGQTTAQHRKRMWWGARDMLKTGVLQRWAYVIGFAPCAPGAEEATFEQLKEFIAAAVPEFHTTSPPPPIVRAAAN
jgi:hypothetical protein